MEKEYTPPKLQMGITGPVLWLKVPFYQQSRDTDGMMRVGKKKSVEMPLERLQKLSVALVHWGDKMGYNTLGVEIVDDNMIDIRISKGGEDRVDVIFECVLRQVLIRNSILENIVIGDLDEMVELADALRKEYRDESRKLGWPYSSTWRQVGNSIIFVCSYAEIGAVRRGKSSVYLPVALYKADRIVIEETLVEYTDVVLMVSEVNFRKDGKMAITLECVEETEMGMVAEAIGRFGLYLADKIILCPSNRMISFCKTTESKKIESGAGMTKKWEVVQDRLIIYCKYQVGEKMASLVYYKTDKPKREELDSLKRLYTKYRGDGYSIEKCVYNCVSHILAFVVVSKDLKEPEALFRKIAELVYIPFVYPSGGRFIRIQPL